MPRFSSARLVAASIAMVVSSRALSAQLSARPARVDVVVPAAPIPVAVRGGTALAYELHVTNFGMGALALREVDVFDARRVGDSIAVYRDSALDALLQPVGAGMTGMGGMDMPAGGARRIEPGQRTIVYMWLTLPRGAVPAGLRHRLLFDVLDTADQRRDEGTEESVDSIGVTVSRDTALLIRAPLDGGEWVLGGSDNQSVHRRSVGAVDGHARISQRYAIDIQKIGPNGNTFHDDAHKNENYWAFGEPVHSVAAGEVVMIIDSIADHDAHGPIPHVTVQNIAGNCVIVRIAPNRYAFYAHLKEGSVRVHLHQQVTRGQVIGQIGMTGQTTGPHLHFHISDRPSFLGSEGVPFRLEAFQFLGMAADFEETHHVNVARRGEMPLDNYVIGLPSPRDR